jgi:GntR family transcriptional regulator
VVWRKLTTRNSSGIPAYQRIQSTILQRIKTGELKPGDTVDSERELARIHGVSLMTARHALTELERDGAVVRRRGTGTFVAPPKIHFNKLMSFTEQMASRGLAGSSKLISARIIEHEPEIAARLALSPEHPLLIVERLRQGETDPFAVETCYLSAEKFSGLLDARLQRGSLFSILEKEYGLQIAYADEEIDAIAADARTAKLIAVPRGAPLLRIRQVIYSASGTREVYVLGLYRADRHVLNVRRFR